MHLTVSIEKNGKASVAGYIDGNYGADAVFRYAPDYMADTAALPISISLPFQYAPFSAERTSAFFDGLLPEGFTRKTVARALRADENDYLRILSELGRECLGAIRIKDESAEEEEICAYEPLSIEQVHALAEEGTSKSAELVTKAHLSLTGASGKAGLYYSRENNSWYLPKGCAPSTHIVKQSHVRMNGIVTNERLSLLTASKLGMDVPDSFIINTGSHADSDVLFATARYDRCFSDECATASGMKMPLRLHQEDFAQALGIKAADKYENPGQNYLKLMMTLLRNYSDNPIRDQLKLWDAMVFNYLIGNTDCHIKNFSLLYASDMRSLHLAPIYDVVSTAVYENTSRDMAMNIGGEYSIDRIDRASFEKAAEESGIGRKIAMQRYDYLRERFEPALAEAAEELEADGFKTAPAIKERILLTGGIGRK